MPNRTAKLVSALSAGFLAGVPLTAASSDAVRAAEDCLAAPKEDTPPGSHWYYRIEHGSKRHCWYARPQHDKPSPLATSNSSVPVNLISPKAESPVLPSLADARAELPAPTRIEAPPRFDAPAPALPADTAVRAPDPDTQRSAVASRWPEPSGARLSAKAEATSVPVAPAISDPTSERQSGSIRMLLVVILAALALAGVLASAILRFGGSRGSRHASHRERRGVNWVLADEASDAGARWAGFARELRRGREASDAIAVPFPRPSSRTRT